MTTTHPTTHQALADAEGGGPVDVYAFKVALVRELLTCLWGPTKAGGPDTLAAAKGVGVSRRTIQRWVSADASTGLARIPKARLAELLTLAQVPLILRNNEAGVVKLLESVEVLNRTSVGRQHIQQMYGRRRWLSPHEVVVTADRSLPVQRVQIVRVDSNSRAAVLHGQDPVVWVGEQMTHVTGFVRARGRRAIAPDQEGGGVAVVRGVEAIAPERWTERVEVPTYFDAERLRLRLLGEVEPYRVHTERIAQLPHNATVWLASAPRQPLSAFF